MLIEKKFSFSLFSTVNIVTGEDYSLTKRLHFVNMFISNFIWFCLFLAVVPQVISSKRVNTSASDGKVIVTGDHNEIVVSAARESKITLAEIQRKLKAVEKSNAELLVQVRVNSQRLSALERQGTIFYRIKLWLSEIQSDIILFIVVRHSLVRAYFNVLNNLPVFLQPDFSVLFYFLSTNSFLSFAFDLAADNYALLFPRKGTSDYVTTRGMPSLKAVTVCLWMKSSEKNDGTSLSYATSRKNDNELLLSDYRKFSLWVGNKQRCKYS